MRIFFTAIFVFFIFGNANSQERKNNDALLKGEVIAYFIDGDKKKDWQKSIITRYEGQIYECYVSFDYGCYLVKKRD